MSILTDGSDDRVGGDCSFQSSCVAVGDGTQERARRAFTLLAPQTIYSIVLRAPYSSNNNEVKFEASALKLTSSEREASVYMY